jgi:hypothetical protein
MKTIALSFFLIMSYCSFGQLIGGKLLDDGRKLISSETFQITDNNVGTIVYELAVNNKGIVTSAKLISDGTNIISTPTRIKARNYATKLKFEEGTYYPEFHFVRVKITVNK